MKILFTIASKVVKYLSYLINYKSMYVYVHVQYANCTLLREINTN